MLPTALAMGWLHYEVETVNFPESPPGDFYHAFFRDDVHPNAEGAFLVECTWYAAIYGESPEGKVLPSNTDLSSDQAREMARLAVGCHQELSRDAATFKEGATPVCKPEISAGFPGQRCHPQSRLKSSTEGAWFRYTLDGTPQRVPVAISIAVLSVPAPA